MDTESLSVYYLRVTLKDSEPSIWRDVLVPSNLTLEELHYVIQTVMGWDNCHLHQFIAGKVFYNDGLDSVHNFDDTEEYDRNERKYTVSDLLPEEKSSIIYEYDLGDSWTHQIVLKKSCPLMLMLMPVSPAVFRANRRVRPKIAEESGAIPICYRHFNTLKIPKMMK